MKKLILTICFCFIATLSSAAEFLVKANPHWQDGWKQSDINKLSESELKSHNARLEIGDIVVIRPNGWVWGREECLPDYYIIKVPNLTVEDAKYLEQNLEDVDGNILKRRKYKVPPQIINQLDSNGGVLTINVTDDMIANLIVKVK